jgi:hypothetical protein
MMEHDELNRNDQLGSLISQMPLDSPSDDFIDRVMMAVQVKEVELEARKSWWDYLKSAIPYAAIILFIALVYFTSDMSFFKGMTGESVLVNQLFTFFGNSIRILASAFSTGYVSWGILIGISGGLIYLIDQAFTRKASY